MDKTKNTARSLYIDATTKTLKLNGNCLDLTPLCKSICCREWDVPIINEDLKNYALKHALICQQRRKPCKKPEKSCTNRRLILKKKTDGSCVYLDENSRCTIYEKRPNVCRKFSCKNGWKLSSILPYTEKKRYIKNIQMTTYINKFDETMTFIKNPNIQLKTCFYIPEKKEIVLVIKNKEICGMISKKDYVDILPVNDNIVTFIYNSFNSKNTLIQIVENCNKLFHIELKIKDLYKLIYIFYKYKILVHIR